jgi:hypothetical protein
MLLETIINISKTMYQSRLRDAILIPSSRAYQVMAQAGEIFGAAVACLLLQDSLEFDSLFEYVIMS